jgi:hypothetical protein
MGHKKEKKGKASGGITPEVHPPMMLIMKSSTNIYSSTTGG